MMWMWGLVAGVGLGLILWSDWALPTDVVRMPARVRRARFTRQGPYRWLRHPMYLGNVLLLAGLAGLAGGWLNALAVGGLAEMVCREWAWREEGRPGSRG